MQIARFSVEDVTCYEGDWSNKQRQSFNKGVKIINCFTNNIFETLETGHKKVGGRGLKFCIKTVLNTCSTERLPSGVSLHRSALESPTLATKSFLWKMRAA